nr:MAG TPA: hypothetical protein [Caudoviricetes sp.]
MKISLQEFLDNHSFLPIGWFYDNHLQDKVLTRLDTGVIFDYLDDPDNPEFVFNDEETNKLLTFIYNNYNKKHKNLKIGEYGLFIDLYPGTEEPQILELIHSKLTGMNQFDNYISYSNPYFSSTIFIPLPSNDPVLMYDI